MVKKPDPKTQFEKTPAKVRVIEIHKRIEKQIVGYDEKTGEPIYEDVEIIDRVPRWKPLQVGTGEYAELMRLPEWLEGVRSPYLTGTIDALEYVYEEYLGEVYDGLPTKEALLKRLAQEYFNTDLNVSGLPQTLTAFEHLVVLAGRWGLGCPHNCGRYWALRPTTDLESFLPVDPAAHTGKQAEIINEWDSIEPDYIWVEGVEKPVENPKAGEVTHYYHIRDWNDKEQVVTVVPVNRGYLDWHVESDNKARFTCDRCGKVVTLE